MQHLGVNFGGIWMFELGFLYIGFFVFFWLKKSGLIFKKSSGNTAAHSTANLRHVVYKRIVQCHYLSVLIRDHLVSLVNERC